MTSKEFDALNALPAEERRVRLLSKILELEAIAAHWKALYEHLELRLLRIEKGSTP